MTDAQADAQIEKDKAAFVPYYAKSYMYEELLALDAGTWFNDASPEQAVQVSPHVAVYTNTSRPWLT